MKGLDAIISVVENGTTAEATLAVSSIFPDLVNEDTGASALDNLDLASTMPHAFGLSWSRRQDGVVTVYDQHHTGMRSVFHPLSEVPTNENVGIAKALVLATLRSIPVSRPYLLAAKQESS